MCTQTTTTEEPGGESAQTTMMEEPGGESVQTMMMEEPGVRSCCRKSWWVRTDLRKGGWDTGCRNNGRSNGSG